ncbi:hypothetical protein [Nevskia soli]|uniref:hypothetical protein n=1 Tax=Nevskia soli TaxID=418856 RepID=UPI0004A75DE5|nr:hypothetical protein [Nevskia soli]
MHFHIFLQLPPAMLRADSGGVQAYTEDLVQMRAILSSTPPQFSWWTAVLLLLIVATWFAALAAGWIYLSRRLRRARDSRTFLSAPRQTPLAG